MHQADLVGVRKRVADLQEEVHDALGRQGSVVCDQALEVVCRVTDPTRTLAEDAMPTALASTAPSTTADCVALPLIWTPPVAGSAWPAPAMATLIARPTTEIFKPLNWDILTLLDLGGVPLRAEDRGEEPGIGAGLRFPRPCSLRLGA